MILLHSSFRSGQKCHRIHNLQVLGKLLFKCIYTKHTCPCVCIILVRLLDAHYPHIPTLLEFVLSVSSQCANKKLQLLLTFVSSIEKLKLCGQMLPLLVDFYLWLHKNLAYQVTMKRAREIKIAEVIDMVSKYHSDDTGNHLKSTYGRLKGSYDSFVFKELHEDCFFVMLSVQIKYHPDWEACLNS